MDKKMIIYQLDKIILKDDNIDMINELNDNTDLIDDMYYDSLDIVQLIVVIEETFDICIDDNLFLIENLRSYKWWKKYILKELANKRG